MSSASEQANRRASGPVLQSVFLAVLDRSALMKVDGVKVRVFGAVQDASHLVGGTGELQTEAWK